MTKKQNTKLIPLTQRFHAIVDAADYEWLNQWKWYYNTGYAMRAEYLLDFKNKRHQRKILMHREILGTPKGIKTDHWDLNRLNNTRKNLRQCTDTQNQGNTNTQKHSSQYKGVSWDKQHKKWRAYIRKNYLMQHLGLFQSEVDAALAYNETAKQYVGEFARLNII